MIKGVALDLEGTLIDVEFAHHLAHIEAAKEVGVELTREEAISTISSFIGGPDIEVAREIAKRATRGSSATQIMERKRRHYARLLKAIPVEPRPGVLAVLRQIQELGLHLAIGSVTPRAEGIRLLRAASLQVFFRPEACVFAEDVTAMKPYPEVYQQTAARMYISPAEQLVFEDSPQGVKAAVAAGSIVIGIPTMDLPELAGALVKSGADSIFWSWEQIDFPRVVAILTKKSGKSATYQ